MGNNGIEDGNTSDLQVLFDSAVEEYTTKRQSVIKGFVSGIIDLGGILLKYRETMKAEGKWIEYCDAIGTNVSQANAQIRFFEFASVNTAKDALAKIVTNWSKLNTFLSLDAFEKEQILSDETIDENTTSEEFREKVVAMREEEAEEHYIPNETESHSRELMKEQIGGTPQMENPDLAAELLQKDLQLSINSRQYLKARVLLENAIQLLTKNPPIIKSEEKEQLKRFLSLQSEELKHFLSTF